LTVEPTGVRSKKAPECRFEATSRFAIHDDVCEGPGPLANPSESVQCKPLQVIVDGKGVERAIKHLKRKLAAEGLLRELKKRRHYMKPSIKKRKKIAEAARRRRKRERIIE
jgi:small subunit ribosomal protein S21